MYLWTDENGTFRKRRGHTVYQFQSTLLTPRKTRKLFKMADGRFPFLSFILGLISDLIGCFQANLALLIFQCDYSRRRQNIIRLISLPVSRGGEVGSPFSLTLLFPRLWRTSQQWRHQFIISRARNSKHVCVKHAQSGIAWVASVSVRFRSKKRGTRVKDHAKNGTSKRAGREGGSFLSPSPLFHFLPFVSLLVRRKQKIPFLGLFLLRNQTERLLRRLSRVSYRFQIDSSYTSGRAKTMRKRYEWARIFCKTEKKSCVFKQIRIRVDRAIDKKN